jgi:hypothetical protein
MGDRTYTTVCAWPWPGERNLPVAAREELGVYGFAGIEDAPDRQLCEGELLDGDDRSGTIFAVVDGEANYGTEAYRSLITALHDAGLNVYATNASGGEYGSLWEYHPAGGATIERPMSEHGGVTVICAAELLAECWRSEPGAVVLTDVDDAIVGEVAKQVLADPELPPAVRAIG